MGQQISAAREQAQIEADETKKHDMEQRLQILEKLVKGRLDNELHNILEGRRGDQEIHTGTIVAMHQQVNIKLSEKDDQDIDDAIDDFFSGDIIGGLKNIVKLGANTVLGNASMGEYEANDMFIVWTSNALLRCDSYYYRWNFTSHTVIDNVEGCVGVLLVKRVIDATKVDPQVLTYAISNQAAYENQAKDGKDHDESDYDKEEKRIEGLVDEAMKVLEKIVAFDAKVKKIEASGGNV